MLFKAAKFVYIYGECDYPDVRNVDYFYSNLHCFMHSAFNIALSNEVYDELKEGCDLVPLDEGKVQIALGSFPAPTSYNNGPLYEIFVQRVVVDYD